MVIVFIVIMTGCGMDLDKDGPPQANVQVKGEKVEAITGVFHWETEGWFSTRAVVVDAPSSWQMGEKMEGTMVGEGDIATISFSDDSNPRVTAFVWKDAEHGKRLPITGNELKLPTESGKHVIELTAIWENGEASYTIVVDVK